MLRWVLLGLLFGVCASAEEETPTTEKPVSLPRGWGNDITWVPGYEEGLQMAASSKKPLMVIHHREDCPHSKALKRVFSVEADIQEMAKEDFIMVNLVEEPSDPNMAPDGYYVPRILFVDPSMVVRTDISGRYSNHRFTYEPRDMALLAANMEKVKALLREEL